MTLTTPGEAPVSGYRSTSAEGLHRSGGDSQRQHDGAACDSSRTEPAGDHHTPLQLAGTRRVPGLGGGPFDVVPTRYAELTSDVLIAVLVFLLFLFQAFFSEKIPVNNGFGWDGFLYGTLAKDFYRIVSTARMDPLRIPMILPSAVVHYSCRLLGVRLDDPNIVLAFSIYEAVLLGVSAFLWCRSVPLLEISPRGKALGLLALFGNYGLLKHAVYYPILADVTGFSLGMLFIYSYLTRKTWLLYVATLTSCFSWPTGLTTGAFMILFPRSQAEGTTSRVNRHFFHVVIAIVLAVYIVDRARLLVRDGFQIPSGTAQPIATFLTLSYLTCFAYVSAAVASLLNWDELFRVQNLLRRLRAPGFYLGLAFLAITARLPSFIPHSNASLDGQGLIDIFVVESIAKPGVFLLAHIIYFGPILLLAIFLWGAVCRLVHDHGIGLTLSLTFAAISAVDSESRHLLGYFPLLAPFVVKATDNLNWDLAACTVFAGCSLLLSKVWLTINPLPNDRLFLDFPWQRYFMSLGPWMSGRAYLAQTAAVVGCGLLLLPFVRRVDNTVQRVNA